MNIVNIMEPFIMHDYSITIKWVKYYSSIYFQDITILGKIFSTLAHSIDGDINWW